MEEGAKDIIDAADRTRVVSLKMEAEAYYILSNKINMNNMVDELVYAHSLQEPCPPKGGSDGLCSKTQGGGA